MAKPPCEPEDDEVAIYVAVHEGRMEDAKRIAIELLLHRGDRLSCIAAGLLMPGKQSGKRGPKKRTVPKHWLEIGKGFDLMRRAGFRRDAAIKKLIEEYGYKHRTLEATLAFYKKTQKLAAPEDGARHLQEVAQNLINSCRTLSRKS
jgi:hypothetical protein